MNRLDQFDRHRDSDEALARLQRASWMIGDAAFAVEGSDLGWVVSGRNEGESHPVRRGDPR